ncbi:MAG: hypothetical protein AAFY73_00120 [Pseudomonadota bacterium]
MGRLATHWAMACACLVTASANAFAEESSLDEFLDPNDRIAHISLQDYSGDWPFKASEGFFFCYRVGLFTFFTFHEYQDGPNKVGDRSLGFTLETDPAALILETIASGKFLQPNQDPARLMKAVVDLRNEARARCGPPYTLPQDGQAGD